MADGWMPLGNAIAVPHHADANVDSLPMVRR
jgi:hypothetical protein